MYPLAGTGPAPLGQGLSSSALGFAMLQLCQINFNGVARILLGPCASTYGHMFLFINLAQALLASNKAHARLMRTWLYVSMHVDTCAGANEANSGGSNDTNGGAEGSTCVR